MERQPTRTPWKLGKTEWDYSTIIVKDDQIIARLGSSDFLNAEADAAFIVRAVNAHEELLAALREILAWDDINPTIPAVDVMRARQAIAKAEGL